MQQHMNHKYVNFVLCSKHLVEWVILQPQNLLKKGNSIHTACDCFMPVHLVLYSPSQPCILNGEGQIAQQVPCSLRQHRCNSV